MICPLCGTPQRCIGCGKGPDDAEAHVEFVCFSKTAAHLCTECIISANTVVARHAVAEQASKLRAAARLHHVVNALIDEPGGAA